MSEKQPIEIDPGSVDVDLSDVKRKSITGVVALISRTFLIYLVSIWATFILTVLLSPADYGTFFLVSAVVNFLNYFSDVGLAAALIQKKDKLTDGDLSSTFTVQQLLVGSIVVGIFLASPWIKSHYQLDQAGVNLLWALTISLFMSSLKTIPTVLLEKDLKFDKLVIPQILESLTYNLVAVYLAYKGMGVSSFTYAVLLRGLVGLVAIYVIKPWRLKIGLNIESIKHLLSFGLPYQLNTFLAMIKDDGMTVYLGSAIGQAGLGYIGWANKWVGLPLRFFLDNVNKVAFPAYSKVQGNIEKLRSGTEKTLYFMAVVTFPVFVSMGTSAGPMIDIIPRYEKWTPALIPLYLYLINGAWASISTPLTNLLNAIGKIRFTFWLMVMWTVLTWALMPFMASRFGFVGVAYSAAIIAFTSIVPMVLVKRAINISYTKSLRTPVVASIVMIVFMLLTQHWMRNIFLVLGLNTVGMGIYALTVFILDRELLVSEFKFITAKTK
jgi:O-antigen/teichoic acid export membrane protein